MQSAVLVTAIPSVCLSVCPSHAGTLSRRMKIGLRGLHFEAAKTLYFSDTNNGCGRHTLPPKICAQSDNPSKKRRFRQYLLITSQPYELAKNVQLSRIESRLRAFQRAIDYVLTLPLTPQRVAQKANVSFLWIRFKFNQIKFATKFLYVKTYSGKVVVESFPYLTVYRCWW